MKKFEGKIDVITGASKRIGEVIAHVYAKYCAKLVLAARGEKVMEFAKPEEIGELAAFSGCYESSCITGARIVIDGGMTLSEAFAMGVQKQFFSIHIK